MFQYASVSAETLSVATIERPPFVMQWENGELTGFSIELWKNIAHNLGLEYSFEKYEVFSQMIEDTKNEWHDLAIANISITSDREKVMDFSNPIFDSGLALMTKTSQLKEETFWNYLLLTKMILIPVLLLLVGGILFRAIPKKRWKKNSYMYTLLYLMICSSVITILYTHFHVQNMQKASFSIATLDDKKVWAIAWSTSESFLQEFLVPYSSYDTIDTLYAWLRADDIDVLVHDYPVLKFKAKQDPEFQLVGDTFKKEKYGVAFPKWSDLRERVNIKLLEMQSTPEYDEIYFKYFWED